MNTRSPIVAMLWENWRLSRVEAAQRLVLGLLVPSAVLAFNTDKAHSVALWMLIVAHAFFYFSIAKLNGGRFMDGYKPGFPLYLLYTRPVPTAVLVGVPMLYDAISCAALYVVSVLIIGFAFGTWFPLGYVAACLVANHLVGTCVQWSTRNRIVQWVGSIAMFWPLMALTMSGLDSPPTLIHYTLLALLSVVAFGLTVAGVARQRRGDAVATEPGSMAWSGYPVGLVNLFRFGCPTSSATRAQVWFELKSTGFPALTLGLAIALFILLLSAIGIYVGPARSTAIGISVFAMPLVLFIFAGNAFGIRHKQGRSQASVFEMTQPRGTAQMVGLKLLVRTGCVLAALLAIGLSVWTSGSFMSSWGTWLPDGSKDATPVLLKLRGDIANALAGQSAYLHAAQALVVGIGVGGLVAWQAAREALKARYPRPTLVATWLPAVWGLAIGLLAVAGRSGILPDPVVRTLVLAAMWTATAVLVIAPIYFFLSSLAGRVLTAGYVGGALLVLATFGAACLVLLRAIGVPSSETPAVVIAMLTWPLLLLLLGSALAPWSLNRVRHN